MDGSARSAGEPLHERRRRPEPTTSTSSRRSATSRSTQRPSPSPVPSAAESAAAPTSRGRRLHADRPVDARDDKARAARARMHDAQGCGEQPQKLHTRIARAIPLHTSIRITAGQLRRALPTAHRLDGRAAAARGHPDGCCALYSSPPRRETLASRRTRCTPFAHGRSRRASSSSSAGGAPWHVPHRRDYYLARRRAAGCSWSRLISCCSDPAAGYALRRAAPPRPPAVARRRFFAVPHAARPLEGTRGARRASEVDQGRRRVGRDDGPPLGSTCPKGADARAPRRSERTSRRRASRRGRAVPRAKLASANHGGVPRVAGARAAP